MNDIKKALSCLPPDVLHAILKCTTLECIEKQYQEKGRGFERILKSSFDLPVPLTMLGTFRRSARYSHLYYQDHAVQVDPAVTFSSLSNRVMNPKNAGTRPHLAKMMRVIQSLIHREEVDHFMVGKASVQDTDNPHAHAAMVKRFGKKYKACGYSHVIGLCVLDGHTVETAESDILQMESFFHTVYAHHEKYDRTISNAQSGALSKSPSTAYVTLYIAIQICIK